MANSEADDAEHMRKLFIGGLAPLTDNVALSNYFTKFGEVLDCIVMKDNQTNRSRGFGFVTFRNKESVDKTQQERPHEQGSHDRSSVNKIFLGGLKDQVTEEDLQTFFSQFGAVEKIETFTDKETGRRKGFGFITFQDFDSVDKCYLHAASQPYRKVNIQGVKIEVKKARAPNEMKNGQQNGRPVNNRYGNQGGYNQSYQGGYNQGGYNQGPQGDGYMGGMNRGMMNNMMGGPNPMMGGPGMMSGQGNMMGGPPNMMGGPHNMMGGPHNMMGGPNNPMGGPNNPMGGPNNMMPGQNNMGNQGMMGGNMPAQGGMMQGGGYNQGYNQPQQGYGAAGTQQTAYSQQQGYPQQQQQQGGYGGAPTGSDGYTGQSGAYNQHSYNSQTSYNPSGGYDQDGGYGNGVSANTGTGGGPVKPTGYTNQARSQAAPYGTARR